MKRNPSIELYRCLLMLGIVTLHTLQCAGQGFPLLAQSVPFSLLLRSVSFCVDGFVFISGWYGIKFGWMKIVKLYGLALWCSAVYALLYQCCIADATWSVWGVVSDAVHRAKAYWFVNAYAVLTCLAPIVNAALESQKSRKIFIPLLFVVFVWSYACEVPGLRLWMPKALGFHSHSFLTLLGVYVVARIARLDHWDEKFSTKQLLVMMGVLVFLAFFRLGHYNSPVAALLGGTLFMLFSRLKLGQDDLFGKVILFVAPSMLAVYLLHGCGADFVFVRRLLGSVPADPWVSCVAVILFVFLASVAIDLLRRGISSLLRGWIANRWKDSAQ